jgi:hypothetical protein
VNNLEPIKFVSVDWQLPLPEVKELNGDNIVEVFLKYRAEYLSKIGVK